MFTEASFLDKWMDICIRNQWLYIPRKNFSLVWRRHHYHQRAAKFRPMLGAQNLWAGRTLFYRATPAVTQGFGFPGLIRRTAPFSCLLQHTMGYGGSIQYSYLDPHGSADIKKYLRHFSYQMFIVLVIQVITYEMDTTSKQDVLLQFQRTYFTACHSWDTWRQRKAMGALSHFRIGL